MAPITRTSFEWHLHFPLPKSGIIFFINALLLLWSVTLAKTLEPILWDKNNSNFTENGMNITVEINDIIDIKCPRVPNTEAGRLKAQYHKFTQVSYQGYQMCSTAGRKRLLLSCNRPFDRNELTLLFQQYTPYPGGATFSHGEEYYFITTSNGTSQGIDNSYGGLCQTNYMKLRVYIKPAPTASPTTGNPNISTVSTPPSTTTSVRPTTRTTTRPPTTPTTPTTTVTTTMTTATMKGATEKSTTAKEANNIADGMGSNSSSRTSVSTSLLLVTWLVAVVRWVDP